MQTPRWLFSVLPSALLVVSSACSDDETSEPPSTPNADASVDSPRTDTDRPAADGGADATGDGASDSGAVFTAKDVCDAPLPIVEYAGSDYATRPVLASAPGSPIVAGWDRSTGGSANIVEAKLFAGGTWGALATLSSASQSGTQLVGAGGGHVLFAVHETNDTGIVRRSTGASFADVGSPTAELLNLDEKALRVGAGGHAVLVFRASDTAIGAILVGPTGSPTALPDNAVSGAVSRATAAVDSGGDGFVVWLDASTNDVVGRAIRAGSWKGNAAKLAVGGVASHVDAALLPSGDAYVVWSRTDASPGVFGATLHLDTGTSTSTWSGKDDLLTGTTGAPLRVVASADGELTALWGQNAGSGTAKLTARRRMGAAGWSAPATLGKTTERFDVAIDASGHVTAAAAEGLGAAYHHRIAKGSTTWSPPVRVDATSGAGNVGGNIAMTLDPTTGNPILAWASVKSILYTICH